MKYHTQLGEEFVLQDLPEKHRAVLEKVRRDLANMTDPDEVSNFIQSQGLKVWRSVPFRERRKLPLRRILRDLEARKLIELGFARIPSYREQLEEIIEVHFDSVAQFCLATGLSPSLVSHVLKGDKNISLEVLEKALARIGYRIKLVGASAGRRRRPSTLAAAS